MSFFFNLYYAIGFDNGVETRENQSDNTQVEKKYRNTSISRFLLSEK